MDGLGGGSDCAWDHFSDCGAVSVVSDLSAHGEEQPRCTEAGEGKVGEDGADDQE